ncbi:MAG: DUF5329 domain-containing protein [Serpentinimonas sp.]|nr:DUF5329 domain-containing protein [Serpentinimonas sp.]
MSGLNRTGAGRRLWLAAAAASALAGALYSLPAWSEAPPAQAQRIEQLLQAMERQEGVTFERNGRRVSSADAVRFLRAKWQRHGAGVSTAEEFIERIASRSSTTGRDYLVCGAGLACTPAGPWLRRLLLGPQGPEEG